LTSASLVGSSDTILWVNAKRAQFFDRAIGNLPGLFTVVADRDDMDLSRFGQATSHKAGQGVLGWLAGIVGDEHLPAKTGSGLGVGNEKDRMGRVAQDLVARRRILAHGLEPEVRIAPKA
jgi:hypothetical protein